MLLAGIQCLLKRTISSDSSECEAQPHASTVSSSPHMPECHSKIDAVTMDPLPSKHICYISPDRKSQQCFALETLHKIALTSSIRNEEGGHTFLQPPHFRSPASDDLIDQIASRFGRAALNLHGDFFNRGKKDCGYMVHFGENLQDNEAFQDRLNDYISNCMGSQDIYCCPLCYIESHRRLANLASGQEDYVGNDDEEEPDGEREDDQSIIKLWHDPMTVLGFVDNDAFKIASVFCFSKVADVKRHLREAHNVDTRVLENNDMFPRFKVSSDVIR